MEAPSPARKASDDSIVSRRVRVPPSKSLSQRGPDFCRVLIKRAVQFPSSRLPDFASGLCLEFSAAQGHLSEIGQAHRRAMVTIPLRACAGMATLQDRWSYSPPIRGRCARIRLIDATIVWASWRLSGGQDCGQLGGQLSGNRFLFPRCVPPFIGETVWLTRIQMLQQRQSVHEHRAP
jgi:hypothetical protein